jgi:DNA processing protein
VSLAVAQGYRPGDRRELAALLALLAVPGLRPGAAVELLLATGSARSAFGALGDACGEEVARASRTEAVRERTRRALHAVEAGDLHVVAVGDAGYPALLAERLDRDRPPVLFGRGRLSLLEGPAVAVVGCRSASSYGLAISEELGSAVARSGGCVVSGVALGIDAAAHTGALEAGGHTIGVLGCGVDVYYPRRNTELQDRIGRDGLLLSEQLPGEAPRKYFFPWRNRIIAGLSRVVVVVEAGVRSGTLSTAEHAANLGIDVFAVPNALDTPNMGGIVRLYREGVAPYTGIRDLLEHVGLIGLADPAPDGPGAAGASPANPLTTRVWLALDRSGRLVDDIAAQAGLGVPAVQAALLELELDGYARRLAGGRYCRNVPQPRAPRGVTAMAADGG